MIEQLQELRKNMQAQLAEQQAQLEQAKEQLYLTSGALQLLDHLISTNEKEVDNGDTCKPCGTQ